MKLFLGFGFDCLLVAANAIVERKQFWGRQWQWMLCMLGMP
jgi:hypothetical protein